MPSDATPTSACPGCGDRLPVVDGATHPYIGASSACWIRFAERSMAPPPGADGRWWRLLPDVYAVQHPGVPERRAIQSVGVHLMGLTLVLEDGLPVADLASTLQRILRRPPTFRWLEPPVPNGSLTIGHVLAAPEGPPAGAAAEAYVRSVVEAWSPHRDTVAGWLRDVGLRA